MNYASKKHHVDLPDFEEDIPVAVRKRSRRHQPMTTFEKVEIVHQVLIGKMKLVDVAQEHRVSVPLVSRLTCKVKKNPEHLRELISQRDAREARLNVIKKKVVKLNETDHFIDSVASVKKMLEEEEKTEYKERDIKLVMKKELKMSYRKVKMVPSGVNSEKSLVLRQQYALKMLELLASGKVILNVDESWCGMTDFRVSKWRAHHTTNSVPKKLFSHRITMIIGLDTRGKVYLTLARANSNAALMKIYLHQLVKTLDAERADWRKDTVLLFDNATYHHSSATRDVYQSLQIPVIFSGPNSYDTAPVELWFAAFKSADINPRQVKFGKR